MSDSDVEMANQDSEEYEYLSNEDSDIEYTYDEFGNTSSIRYFNNKGNKTNARIGCIDGSTSAHLIKFIYSKNTLVQQELFTKNGKIPIKVIDCFKDKYINSWGVSTKSSSFNN